MADILKPSEPEIVSCDICMKEIPKSGEHVAEAEDYVVHFCGIDCYQQWREKNTDQES